MLDPRGQYDSRRPEKFQAIADGRRWPRNPRPVTSCGVVHLCETDALDVGYTHSEHQWAPSEDQNSQLSPAGSPSYVTAQIRTACDSSLGTDQARCVLPASRSAPSGLAPSHPDPSQPAPPSQAPSHQDPTHPNPTRPDPSQPPLPGQVPIHPDPARPDPRDQAPSHPDPSQAVRTTLVLRLRTGCHRHAFSL